MFKEDIQKMIGNMTSFYQENLPIDSSYEKILNAYIQSFLVLWQEATYLRKHIALEDAPTLKLIKYAKINMDSARYSKPEASRIAKISTLEEKLNELNRLGKYEELVFSELGSRIPVVYDMTLKDKFSSERTLSLYDDYFIRNNRLYLLPSYILRVEEQIDYFHAFDIRIDNWMMEKKWGADFEIETGSLLPRFKYRDVISAFRRLLSSDLSIREMKEAVKLATGWEEFNIQDMHSVNLHPSLRKLYDEWMVSPARFIISLPEELIVEKMQLNILLSLMDESKEAQINYLVLFHIIRTDRFDRYSDTQKPTIHMGLREINKGDDKNIGFIRMKDKDLLFPTHRYDVGRHYDYKLLHDSDDVVFLDSAVDTGSGVTTDTPLADLTDYVKIRHVQFPEIPRNLVAAGTGTITFAFKTNMDGTLSYELLGSKEEYGEYQVLETIDNNESLQENVIIHNASLSGMRYYKVRAAAGEKRSLLTLPIDSSAI